MAFLYALLAMAVAGIVCAYGTLSLVSRGLTDGFRRPAVIAGGIALVIVWLIYVLYVIPRLVGAIM
jgi:hypothetical protein